MVDGEEKRDWLERGYSGLLLLNFLIAGVPNVTPAYKTRAIYSTQVHLQISFVLKPVIILLCFNKYLDQSCLVIESVYVF